MSTLYSANVLGNSSLFTNPAGTAEHCVLSEVQFLLTVSALPTIFSFVFGLHHILRN